MRQKADRTLKGRQFKYPLKTMTSESEQSIMQTLFDEKIITNYSVVKYSIALSEAQQKKTAMHVAV